MPRYEIINTANIWFLFFLLFFFIFVASGMNDGCLAYYGFDEESDIPDSTCSDGWQVENGSYVSGESPQSKLCIDVQGPSEVSFKWKKEGKDAASGLFIFYVDDKIHSICRQQKWEEKNNIDLNDAKTYRIKWLLSKGSNEDLRGLIDNLCVRTLPCSKSCSSAEKDNQPPIINSLNPDKEMPQEAGSIIVWKANASDIEKDQIFYKFLLNNQLVQEWSNEESWLWNTTGKAGENHLEVRIRDRKHNGADGYDDRKLSTYKILPPYGEINASKTVRSGLIETAFVSNCGPETSYDWSIDGGKILSGQGTDSIKWTGISNEARISIKIIDGNGNSVPYHIKDVAVIPNSKIVGVKDELNNLINNTDITEFYLNGRIILEEPIIINTSANKNNRSFINILPILNGFASLENRHEKDFVVAIDNSTNVSILNLSLKNGKYGIIIENSTFIELMNNIIDSTFDDGIYVKSSSFCHIYNNKINVNIDNESGITLLDCNYSNLTKNPICNNHCNIPRIKINITGKSEKNEIDMLGNNFIFYDSGYQCYYNGTCNCCCKDRSLCNGESLTGVCVDIISGRNLIDSPNSWKFSG
jgi:parallel beta-helix repeat protein